jgi:hypothetical protein
MKVTVKLQGMVGRSSGAKAGQPIDLILPDGATVGHVLRELGERFGEPFAGSGAGSEGALPASLRVFVEGELCLQPHQTSLARGAPSTNVTVVIMSPIAGGSR